MVKRKLEHKQLLDKVVINTGCLLEDVRASLEIYAETIVDAVAVGESLEVGKLAVIRYITHVKDESIYLKDMLTHEDVLRRAEDNAKRKDIYVLRKVVEETLQLINKFVHSGYSVSLYRILMVNVDVEDNVLDIALRLSPAIQKEKVRAGVFLILTKDGDVVMKKLTREDLALSINVGEWLM